jgi:hypothetical protein
MKVTYTTKACSHCGKTSKMKLDGEAYDNWRGGMYVQRAFPGMSSDDRELLVSGTHPKCWDEMFPEE